MKTERHEESIKEVLEEIDAALRDGRGLVSHQRRLMFMVSFGMAELAELYLHKVGVIKNGASVNHMWFKRRKNYILEKVQSQIYGSVGLIENFDEVVNLAMSIEEKRDDLAYGVPVGERVLMEKINLFFKLKELVRC